MEIWKILGILFLWVAIPVVGFSLIGYIRDAGGRWWRGEDQYGMALDSELPRRVYRRLRGLDKYGLPRIKSDYPRRRRDWRTFGRRIGGHARRVARIAVNIVLWLLCVAYLIAIVWVDVYLLLNTDENKLGIILVGLFFAVFGFSGLVNRTMALIDPDGGIYIPPTHGDGYNY